MKYQRGFGLIAYAIAAVALLAIIGGIWAIIDRTCWTTACRKQEIRASAAELRAANSAIRATELNFELSEAVEINKRNKEEVAALRERFAETQKVLDDIKSLQVEQQKQQEKARAALATFSERDKRQASEIRRLRVIAETPGVTITDRGASEADTILRDAVRDILGLR